MSSAHAGRPASGPPPVDLSLETRPIVLRMYRATTLLLLGLGVAATIANSLLVADSKAARVAVLVDLMGVGMALLDLRMLRSGRIRWSSITLISMLSVAMALLVWGNHRESYVFVMLGMILMFVRLPFWLALTGATAIWLFSLGAYHWRWHAEPVAMLRVAESGAVLLILLTIVRRAFDESTIGLRTTSGLLRDTLESMNQGVAVLDREGWIRLYNHRVVEVLEVPAAMMDGRAVNVADITRLQRQRGDLEELDITSPEVVEMISRGGSVLDPQLPDRYVRRGKAGDWIEVSTKHLASGSIIRTYSDVTSYVEARRAAERAAADRTTFLAHLSHEFRTPMNAIVGLTHLMLQEEQTGERKDSLLGVEAAAQQVRQLVDDMLDLALLESGTVMLGRMPFVVREVIDRVVARKASVLTANANEVHVEIATGADRRLLGDASRLERMLSTLVRNAARFTERGRIEVRADGELVAPSLMRLRLEVTDTGRGLSPTERQRLMEAFRNPGGDDETDGAYSGVALVRRYAELMGGTVGIQGAHGEGTTFWFSVVLPLAGAANDSATDTAVPAAMTGGDDAGPPRRLSREAPIVAARLDRASSQDDANTRAGAPAPAVAAEAPEVLPSVSRLRALLDSLSVRRSALDMLPYRTWRISTAFGAAVFSSLTLVNVVSALQAQRAVFSSGMLVTLAFAVSTLFMTVRHRTLSGNFERDARLHLLLSVCLYWWALRTNALAPATLMSAGLVSVYIVHSRRIARLASAVVILSTPLLLSGLAVDQFVLARAIAAALASAALMEWLRHNLGEIVATLDEAGGALGALSDDLVQDNEQLRKAVASADRAVELRTTLMAAVSHEIRTPMNAILGLSRLVSDGSLSPQQREWMVRIRENGQHLLRLVNDVLDLTRIEAGKASLEIEPVDLNAVLDQVADVLVREGQAKGLRTRVTVAPDVPRCVHGDRMRLVQLLLNLVNNAVKYTEQGEVGLHVSCLVHEQATSTIRFEVVDSGIGLTAEQQSRLFQPFEQLEAGGAIHGGAGLGLSICKWIADQMRGSIEVDSVRGAGSTFRFTVPLMRGTMPDGDAGATPTPRAEHLRGARVLVVDDHLVNREVACELLRRKGVIVYEASDGQAALAAVDHWRPDLVLMDIQMPVLNGIEATRRLRARDDFAGLPVIALTAAAFPADEVRCREAGMNDFLVKPVEPEALTSVIAKWLPRRPSDEAHRVVAEAVPSASDSSAVDPLSLVKGLDLAAGLRRVDSDRSLYVMVLQNFVATNADVCERVRAALASGDFAEARRAAHSLSGAAATLGATAVHRRARALESAIVATVDKGVRDEALDDLREAANPLFEELRHALAAERDALEHRERAAGVTGEPMAPADAAARRERLATLMRASDPQALSYLRDNMELVAAMSDADRLAFVQAVESLDLAVAAERWQASGFLGEVAGKGPGGA